MHICRFTRHGDSTPRLGLLEGGTVRDVTAATEVLAPQRWPLPPGDQLIAGLPAVRARIAAIAAGAETISRAQVCLLSPVANPGKFVCGAGNWKHHGAPFGMMGFMGKAASAAAGEGDGLQISWPDRITPHEPELAIIIGTTCRNVSEADALDHVAGYCLGLDMTLRGKADRSFRKSIDGYSVLGPWLVTADEIPDPDNVPLSLSVNGEKRQESNTKYLIFDVRRLIEFASSYYTLYPGDVFFTGTPAGVGPVKPGDVIKGMSAPIGELKVEVRAHDAG